MPHRAKEENAGGCWTLTIYYIKCAGNHDAQAKHVVYSSCSTVKALSVNLWQRLHNILRIVIDICTLCDDIKVYFESRF